MAKKKRISLIIVAFFSFLVCFGCSACGDENSVASIEYIENSMQTDYFVGDNVDFSKAKFNVIFKTGENLEIDASNELLKADIQNIDTNKEGTQILPFVYDNKAVVEVTLTFKNPTLQCLIIDQDSIPSKVKQNQKIDLSKLKVTAYFSNSTSKVLGVDDVTIGEYSSKTIGKQTISVEYLNLKQEFSIEVERLSFSKMEFSGGSTTFYVGDFLSYENFAINITTNEDNQTYTLKRNEFRVEEKSEIPVDTEGNLEKAGDYVVYIKFNCDSNGVGENYVLSDLTYYLPLTITVKEKQE